MKANDEAIRARDLLLPEVFKQLDDSCTKVHSQKQRVQLFNLHLELQIARARAKAPGSVETNATHSTNVAVLLKTFAPVQEWFFPNVIHLEGIAHSAWGRQAWHSTLRSCVWKLDITQPENLEPGLSWTEIAVAIILEHGAWLPVKRQGDDGITRVVQPMLQGSHCNVTTDLAEQTQSAHALVIHLCSLIPEEIILGEKKGRYEASFSVDLLLGRQVLNHDRRSRSRDRFFGQVFNNGTAIFLTHVWHGTSDNSGHMLQ